MKITYNGYVIDDNAHINKLSVSNTYTELSVSAQFIITSPDEASHVTACNTAEAALREWNRDLEIKFGDGETLHYSLSHAGNTGYLARPVLQRVQNALATGTSQVYDLKITCSLPATQVGYDFRQIATITLDANIDARRTLTFSGKYTAGGADSARANFDQAGRTWAESIAASIFGAADYERTVERVVFDHEDKVADFTLVYQERLAITCVYGAYTVPGTYYKFTHRVSYTNATFSIDFRCLKADELAMLDALRLKDQDLTVTVGTVIYDYKASTNKGFLVKPEVNKKDNLEEGDDYVFYNVVFNFELPATVAGDAYRRDGSYAIAYDSSRRRRVTFTTTYTAGGANSALANYNAGAQTWAMTILAALGFTNSPVGARNWEITQESVTEDQRFKLVNANWTVQEILQTDLDGTTNSEAIQDASLEYSIGFENVVGISLDFIAVPFTPITVSYSAKIDKTKLSLTGIEDLYRDLVRPWIVKRARTILNLADLQNLSGTGDYITDQESYKIHASGSSITGNLTIKAPVTDTQIYKVEETITISRNEMRVFDKFWDGLDFTYAEWSLGAEETLKRRVSISKLGLDPPVFPVELVSFNGGRWRRKSITYTDVKTTLGFAAPLVKSSRPGFRSYPSLVRTYEEEYLHVEIDSRVVARQPNEL